MEYRYNNNILYEDLMNILNDKFIDWDKLNDRTVLISGATGFIGSMLVKTFAQYNHKCNGTIKIIAYVRDEEKANEIYNQNMLSNGIELLVGDIMEKCEYEGQIDYIFHCASVTSSKKMVDFPASTILTSFIGTKNMLDLAVKKNVNDFIFISSMEVYGQTNDEEKMIYENDLGYIDILNERSSYSEGKRAAECLCSCYKKQYNVPIKIVRLAQTFGAGISFEDNRIFAQFAKSIKMNRDIILHTKGNSIGNYCYISDAIRGILYILLFGKNGDVYNVVNEKTTMKIKEMADLVIKNFGNSNTKLVFDIPEKNKFGYNVDVTMHLSSRKLNEIGWQPNYSLTEMYQRLFDYWKSIDMVGLK